jgi:hypothetical protein
VILKSVCAIAILLTICSPNPVWAAGKGDADGLVMAIGQIEECKQVDVVLRDACDAVGKFLSDKNKKFCDLPPESFATRTANSYAAFRQSFRAAIDENESKIAKVTEMVKRSVDEQFAQVRAGNVSMLDLEGLSREMSGRCTVMEQEWLVPR